MDPSNLFLLLMNASCSLLNSLRIVYTMNWEKKIWIFSNNLHKFLNWITVSSTVFLILAPASVTVLPALLTAEAKKLPIVRAPCMALLETSSKPTEIWHQSLNIYSNYWNWSKFYLNRNLLYLLQFLRFSVVIVVKNLRLSKEFCMVSIDSKIWQNKRCYNPRWK